MGFVYLLLILLFCWTLESVKVFTMAQTAANDKTLAQFVNQIPEMNLQNGKLSIDKQSPYTLNDPQSGKPIAMFDTSGQTTDLAHANGATFLLTQDNLIVAERDGSEKTMPWSQMKTDFNVNSAKINDFISKLPLFSGIIFWAFGLFVWIAHILQALLFGAFALLMDSRKLGYKNMVRLAAFAMTPAIVLSLLQFLIGKDIPGFGLLSLAITMGYIYFGTQAVKGDDPPMV